MKTRTLLIAGGIILLTATTDARNVPDTSRALFIPGNYQTIDVKSAAANYLSCLTCGSAMVQESALGYILWLRLMRPDASLERLHEQVKELATNGENPSIRYRAALVNIVMDEPEMFSGLSTREFPTNADLFASVVRTAQTSLLGAR